MSNYLPNLRSRIRWRMRWITLASVVPSLLAFAAAPASAQAQSAAGAHVASLAHKAPKRSATYIVQFKDSVSEAQARALVRSDGGRVLSSVAIIHGLAVRISAHGALTLAKSPLIKGVTLNGHVKAQASAVNVSQLESAYDGASLATNSWGDGYSGLGVGVAVIDSGVAGDLQDFDVSPTNGASRVLASAVVNPEATSASDPYGHGTDVAGIIAGNGWNLPVGNPARGDYIGIAPNANLISIKAGNNDGNATVLDVINGLAFAVEHQAEYNIRVVNLSLASETAQSYKLDPLDAAVETAWLHGIVVVAAAGNLGNTPGAVNYAPGNDPYVITVGAYDDHGSAGPGDDALAPYSSQGVTQDGFVKPELIAPGSHIASTLAPASAFQALCPSCIVAGSYIRTSGTSMSAPVVSGAVALLLQKYPSLSPNQVKGALLANAVSKWGLKVLATKPTLDHALAAKAADQGLTPSAGAEGEASNVSATRSSWRRSSWRVAPESLVAPWARSSWSCTCSVVEGASVDPTRSSWSRSSWSTDFSAG
jgi:serine protease AprX